MVKRLCARLGFTLLLALAACGAATATVELDITPDPAILNESTRLTFRVTGEVDGEPDFTPLEAMFDIIGRNRQTAISWVNGRREESTSWTLSAMPRAAGKVQLPAIRFGAEQSQPRALEVVSSLGTPADDSADILLEVAAEPGKPYVQQQVIYTVRLLHRVELSSPRFSALTTSSDAIVKPLGQGRQYVEKVNGRSFDAFEQRYAIFPQKSGRLTINPVVLTTQVVTGTRSFFDPFSQSLTTRRIESEAIQLDVRAVPASYPAGAAWLPARRLRLHEEWEPDSNTTTAGSPLARTLFLWADGLIAGQLPELSMTAVAGVKLYPDQAQSNEQDTATGYTAVQQQKFAIIATENGDLRFPAVEIPWWNTETDSLETARLPERALGVTGARAPAPAARNDAAVAEATAPATGTPAAASGAVGNDAEFRRWRAAAVIAATGWLVTLAWWAAKSRRERRSAPSAAVGDLALAARRKRARRALEQACTRDDPLAARDALLEWAASGSAAARPQTLGAIAAAAGGDLARAIGELERQLYGRADAPWRGEALAAAAKSLSGDRPDRDGSGADDLPALFKLVKP